jgi:23S rRNA (pseudouridine1915-N3)-methyltransferase
MKLTIIAVGKLKETYWREACEEYLRRLAPYAEVTVVEVADRDSDRLGIERTLTSEAADLSRALPKGAYTIALALDGTTYTSPAFAEHIEELKLSQHSHLCFLIGASVGLAPALLAAANEKLSFGAFTYPHNLARVLLLEQLYRAARISNGHPYHK